MRLFDLHCDTALELYRQGQQLSSNTLHISLERAACFQPYIQTAAVWTAKSLGNEAAWEQFGHVADCLDERIARAGARRVENAAAIAHAADKKSPAFLLAVEDARLLNGYLSRVDALYRRGVRILTLTWSGTSCIGGAFDTDAPLTPFGEAVVRRCFALGIVPDVSHASRRVTAAVLALARECRRPVIASHSNSYSVYAHPRNLTDEEFSEIVRLGGVAGISLAPQHLTDGACTSENAADHILHYLSLGGENAVCLGCDFDGIDKTPADLPDISALPRLAQCLSRRGVSDAQIDRIFFENALGFALRTIP